MWTDGKRVRLRRDPTWVGTVRRDRDAPRIVVVVRDGSGACNGYSEAQADYYLEPVCLRCSGDGVVYTEPLCAVACSECGGLGTDGDSMDARYEQRRLELAIADGTASNNDRLRWLAVLVEGERHAEAAALARDIAASCDSSGVLTQWAQVRPLLEALALREASR